MASTERRATLLHGFSDANRLRIIEALSHGEQRSRTSLRPPLAQSTVSTYVACLWDCGLVARRRGGREVFYRLIDGVTEALAAADLILAPTGDTVGACPRYGSSRAAA